MLLSKELIDRALKVDPAQIGHYVESGFLSPRIQPLDDSFKVIGPAFTVRIPTNDNAMIYYAIKRAPAGSVLVVDRMGENRYACCGEMVVRAAISRGLAGIVIDGTSTDTRSIRELGFPVFSTGRSAVTCFPTGINGECNITISCGGCTIHPGDIIFGDLDGLISCPFDKFEAYLFKAENANLQEARTIRRYQEEPDFYMADAWRGLDRALETGALAEDLRKRMRSGDF